MIHEPAVLIEGVLFRAKYLGSTQILCDGRPTKASRMMQAHEAVTRIKVELSVDDHFSLGFLVDFLLFYSHFSSQVFKII